MKIAFDFGGVLSCGGHIVEFFRALQRTGFDLHIITTVGSDEEGAARSNALRSVGVVVPTENLHVIYDHRPDYYQRHKSHGEAKAAVMREIGCHILFDDADGVIKAVREAGFIGFQTKPLMG